MINPLVKKIGIVLISIQMVYWLSCGELEIEKNRNNQLVFLSNRNKSNSEFDVYLYNLDSKETINVTGEINNVIIRSNSLPKLNQKRNSIFFISYNKRDLVELKLGTPDLEKITAIDYEASNYIISPDGQSIIYTEKINTKLQLFQIDLIDGKKRNLSNNQCNNFEPSFSHDGKKVLYVCDEDGTNSIAIMKRDGSNKKVLTNSFGDDRYPCFSSDSKKIVFSSSRSGLNDSDYDLFMIDTNGKNFKLFNDSKAFDTKPVFSPDNKYVAFISNSRGDLIRDIFLKEIDSGKSINITSELNSFNQNIIFSYDTKFIVFENFNAANSEIMKYDLGEHKITNITNNKNRNVSPSL